MNDNSPLGADFDAMCMYRIPVKSRCLGRRRAARKSEVSMSVGAIGFGGALGRQLEFRRPVSRGLMGPVIRC
jgi:hypothetical protein